VTLTGCAGKVRYPTYYTLNLPAPPDPPAAENAHASLAIREFRAPTYLRQGAIVYKTSPEQIGFYAYLLAPWATRRRKDLLELLDRLNPTIAELSTAIEQEAKKQAAVVRLMTHPGVGPLTGLAFVLIIGPPQRFRCGKQIGSYLGLIPCEDSSAGKQRLGHISKQGNSLMRFLLVEAAQIAVRDDPNWRRKFLHLAMRRGRKIAKVAMARKLAVCLYWMLRKEWNYQQLLKFGSHAGQLETGHGVK
jgi:transposase